jgi:hypothetical protein
MNSVTRPSFWRCYARLDPKVKQAAPQGYRLFFANPEHSSLRFKKLQRYDNVWSERISEQYRQSARKMGTQSSGLGSVHVTSSTANSARSQSDDAASPILTVNVYRAKTPLPC